MDEQTVDIPSLWKEMKEEDARCFNWSRSCSRRSRRAIGVDGDEDETGDITGKINAALIQVKDWPGEDLFPKYLK